MVYSVSITSRGQMSIPADARRKLGLRRKALARIEDGQLIVEPVKSLEEIQASLKTTKKWDNEKADDVIARAVAEDAMKDL